MAEKVFKVGVKREDGYLYFIDKIGLKQNLSPTRSNGLLSMLRQMKLYAMAFGAQGSGGRAQGSGHRAQGEERHAASG